MHGVDRFAARKMIVERLEEKGLVDKIEPQYARGAARRPLRRRHRAVSHRPVVCRRQDAWPSRRSRRCAMARTKFVPKNWEKTYFDWMENIQPWCISRQLWWGHQIPAWYGPDGKVFVADDRRRDRRRGARHYTTRRDHVQEVTTLRRSRVEVMNGYLKRDEDVLDTWFSSALWPFSTLGWPDETPELKRFYPTSVLVTGFDIIFFWVARMMMMGLHFMHEVPFHDRLHPRAGARRHRRQDVEVEGQRHRPAGADRRIRRRRAALHAGARWRRRAATSSSRRSASRATAISRPSCGTPRALPR